MSYGLALDYTYLYSQGGVSLRTYYRALNQRMKDKYKVEDHELMLWGVFRDAIWKFWRQVLHLDTKALFMCESCGENPAHLVCDGVSIGVLVEHLRGVDNLMVPFASPEVLKSPSYQDRHFVKIPSNRKYLKQCAEQSKYPSKKNVKSDDCGMEKVMKLVEELKKTEKKTTEDTKNIFFDLSSASSTVGMFQKVDLPLMCEMREYCQGRRNLIRGAAAVQSQERIRNRYKLSSIFVK